MSEVIMSLKKILKDLFEKNSTWFTLIIAIQVICFTFFTWLIFTAFWELTSGQYHYYANTTKSLEVISGKTFDKYNGDIKKELSTEEQLVRQMNRKTKFRLKDLKPKN